MQYFAPLKFFKEKWKLFVVYAALTTGLLTWLNLTDPHIDGVRDYLISNNVVCDSLGVIEKLSLKKTTILLRPGDYGRAQEPDRKIYIFVATGSKARDRIKVEVKISESDKIGIIDVRC